MVRNYKQPSAAGLSPLALDCAALSSNHLRAQYAIELRVVLCRLVAHLHEVSLQPTEIGVTIRLKVLRDLFEDLHLLDVAERRLMRRLAQGEAIRTQGDKEMARSRVGATASKRERAGTKGRAVRLVGYPFVLPLRLHGRIGGTAKLDEEAGMQR